MNKVAWVFNTHEEGRGIVRELAEGMVARIFVGRNMMLSVVHIAPHSEGRLHSHPEEQWGVLLEGRCTRVQGEEEVEVGVGDFWHTPGGVPHTIRTADVAAVVLDIFSPPRVEYKQAGKGFGWEV